MNILYCGDKNIADGLIISILSIVKHNKSVLHIYILTACIKKKNVFPLEDQVVKYLDKLVKKENKNSFVQKIDITEKFLKELPVKNIDTRFTPCCMLRLFADKIESLPKKILYLDNDVVCRKDFSDFYDIKMNNYEIAGVLDCFGSHFFRKNIFKRDYLNSGVLLMNLEKIKKTKLFKRAREMCIAKNMFMPDQSSLNKLAKEKLIVPRKYNEQRKLKTDTVFQHFTTTFVFFPYIHTRTVKPWDVERMHNVLKLYEYDDILKNYHIVKEEIYEKQ